jgi:hypothetical protein
MAFVPTAHVARARVTTGRSLIARAIIRTSSISAGRKGRWKEGAAMNTIQIGKIKL